MVQPLSSQKDVQRGALEALVHELHVTCSRLCLAAYGQVFGVVGNVAVFCQTAEEYRLLTALRQVITHPSTNPEQKYFALLDPIMVSASGSVPTGTYTHLYIRRPAGDSPERGDIDFVVDHERLAALQRNIRRGQGPIGARLYALDDLEMIELAGPEHRALAYVCVRATALAVRVRRPGGSTVL